MKKKKIIILAILVLPVFLIAGYIMFLMIWFNIPDSNATIFKRITRQPMPTNISNFKVHRYFTPSLGDGGGTISFEVPKEEGMNLIKGFEFKEKGANRTIPHQIDQTDCQIDKPLYYFNNGDVFNRTAIKRNSEATKFIWNASF